MIAVQQNKHPRGNENSSTRNLNGCGANGSVECRLIKKCWNEQKLKKKTKTNTQKGNTSSYVKDRDTERENRNRRHQRSSACTGN